VSVRVVKSIYVSISPQIIEKILDGDDVSEGCGMRTPTQPSVYAFGVENFNSTSAARAPSVPLHQDFRTQFLLSRSKRSQEMLTHMALTTRTE
jgi:hypothetical protein